MTGFPDTREGAVEALRSMAQPHTVSAERRGQEAGMWLLTVRFRGDDEDSRVAVYLGEHPLADDFETLE